MCFYASGEETSPCWEAELSGVRLSLLGGAEGSRVFGSPPPRELDLLLLL